MTAKACLAAALIVLAEIIACDVTNRCLVKRERERDVVESCEDWMKAGGQKNEGERTPTNQRATSEPASESSLPVPQHPIRSTASGKTQFANCKRQGSALSALPSRSLRSLRSALSAQRSPPLEKQNCQNSARARKRVVSLAGKCPASIGPRSASCRPHLATIDLFSCYIGSTIFVSF